MNILQIGSYLYPDTPGGAEISAQNVALALIDRGHRIIRLRWRQSDEMRLAGKFDRVEPGQWTATTWRPYSPLETKRGGSKALFYALEFAAPLNRSAFIQLCETEQIEAVVVHSFRGLGFDLLRRVSSLNLPTTIFLHDFALICLNKGMFRNGSACKKACMECRLVSATNANSLRSIDDLSIIGASRQLVEKTRSALHLDNASFFNIPNPNEYNLLPRERSAPEKFVLGYIGRMEHDKGILQLLDVADKLHDRHDIGFVLAGTGALADIVRQYAVDRPWVDYRGFVQPNEIVNVYGAIDILAVPSLWAENFPGVLVQALGNGVPAIGFDIGGTPEIIQDGITGIVVPVGDFDAMYCEISSLVEDAPRFATMSRSSIIASARLAPALLRATVVEVIERTAAHTKAA
jgi:glycosyltransferase involved in cell wall biosynthesis